MINSLEIAPKVFVESWDQVSHGYRHCCGIFVIVLKVGKEIHIQNKDDVETTIAFWRMNAQAPMEPTTAKIPPDIQMWMNNRKTINN
jgi:hypothetical protein